VANASHELRTPLTSISGYVETLLSLAPPEPPELQRFLAIIQKNVTRMTLLVSELLDLAQLGAKENVGINAKPVLVKEVLEATLQMVNDQAGEKSITIVLETDTIDKEVSGYWEKDRIIQAIFNLLDNAVKYTPPGGQVRLKAKTGQSSEFGVRSSATKDPELKTAGSELGGNFLEIAVEDTGIGIPKEHLPRIFERFYRVDKARSREMGGTGLGLSIVKNIVEAHGGTVQVQSTLNLGSTFRVILPLAGPTRPL
jgi:two-component system phosphate regulon sensor histidine kinase PhoR